MTVTLDLGSYNPKYLAEHLRQVAEELDDLNYKSGTNIVIPTYTGTVTFDFVPTMTHPTQIVFAERPKEGDESLSRAEFMEKHPNA
jgi:hypothetical protein